MKIYHSFLSIALCLTLAACGGGGGGGSSSGSGSSGGNNGGGGNTPNVDLQSEIPEASINTMQGLLDSEEGTTRRPFGLNGKNPPALPILNATLSGNLLEKEDYASTQAITNDSQTVQGSCGGSYTTNTRTNIPDNAGYPRYIDAEIIFDNWCNGFTLRGETYEYIWDGKWIWDFDLLSDTTGTIYYIYDLSYTYKTPNGVETGRYTASERCDIKNRLQTCTESYNHTADSGLEYELSESTISGNQTSGYDVSGKITDNQGNIYTISFTGLTRCTNGNFGTGSGTIKINGEDEIGVQFTSCDEYVATYQGVSKTYTYK